MGWSCRADAAKVMEAWTAACLAQTNSQNVFMVDGTEYFWELSRTEHYDGAITGSIMKVVKVEGEIKWAKRTGSFRIEGNGDIARAPKFLKAAAFFFHPDCRPKAS